MESRIINVVIIIFLAGTLFLGKGITGLSIIENGCTSCDYESIRSDTIYLYLGILSMITAASFYIITHMNRNLKD